MRKRIGLLVVLIALLGLMVTGCGQTNHKHEYGEWQVAKKATCTKDGKRERVCSCGKKETEVIKATGHTKVVDKAVEATCTKDGKTEGSHCSVCKKVFKEQKVIPAAHTEEVLPAVAVTCTRAGKGEGVRCTVCGEVLKRQKKIRAPGHIYKNGRCIVCNKVQPDSAAAILIDQLNEEAPANFITKQAYPGGSTISFAAYVPQGTSWWAVSWTTNPNNIGLYNWANGAGSSMTAETGVWQQCSVTLPKDGKNYYIYIVGAKGEWSNKALLIDDVVITSASGKVAGTDDFNNGLDGLFSVVKTNPTNGHAVVYEKEVCAGHIAYRDMAVAATCTKAGKTEGSHCSLCGKVLVAQKEVPATGHKWVNKKCSICGVEQVNLSAAINIDQLNENAPMNFITKNAYPGGSTVSFKAYVPKNVRGWWAVSWTTDKYNAGMYKWAEGMGTSMSATAGEWTDCTVTLPNDGKNYYIYFVGEKGQWNGKLLLLDELKITNASGKVIAEDNFDNGVNNGLFEIVDVNPTTGYSVITEQKVEDPCKKGHTVVIDKAVEATCTKPGKTEGSHCSVCGEILKAQEEIPAKGHQFNEYGTCTVCGEQLADRAAAINIDQLNERAPMNFITRKAYPGGSTISFKAYVPEDVPAGKWWAVNWTTDPENISEALYQWAYGNGQSMTYVSGEWADYSVTLPNDGQSYYFYISGAKGEWNGKELLVDNFRIQNASGEVIAVDMLDAGIQSGLFKIVETNPTSGRTVVHEVIVEEPCKNGHTIVADAGRDATCTESGLTAGTHCSVCGEVIVAQTVIPARGHQYDEHGTCTVCGDQLVDRAAAINIDQLNENAPMNFITGQAYPGGSTISFKAYVPEDVPAGKWWAVNWTTDPENISEALYQWAYGNGQSMTYVSGEWADYSVTLPNDGQSYYFYISGAKGEWNDKELLVDNFRIQDASGETIAEDMLDAGIRNSIFEIVETNPTSGRTVVREVAVEDACKNGHTMVSDAGRDATCTEPGLTEGSHCSVCDEVLTAQEEIPALGHDYGEDGICTRCGDKLVNRYAAIKIDLLNEGAPMNFITRKAYAGGSTISFKAYVPEGASWWAVSWTTDPADTDLYKWTGGLGKDMTPVTRVGEWADYSVTLPNDGKNYYVYIVGAKGEWWKDSRNHKLELLVDDFQIQTGEAKEKDDFNHEFEEGLFEVVAIDPTSQETIVSLQTAAEGTVENKAVAIKIDLLNEGAPMNFITKKAYAGGSTVSFKAYVPEGASWWAVSWTTDPVDTDLYKWTSGLGKDMTPVTRAGEWADYSVTLPDDGKNYYVYIVGAKGEWKDSRNHKLELLVDDFQIQTGEVKEKDDFNEGFEQGLFQVVETNPNSGDTIVRLQTIEETAENNKVVAIKIDRLNENSPMSFITKIPYAGGSTVSFKAYVPEGASWWAVSWTTDPVDTDLYKWTSGLGKDMTPVTRAGEWADYSVTLPDDGKNYYIYLSGAKGEWWKDNRSNQLELLVDDFKITKNSFTVSDEFTDGADAGLFAIAGEDVVSVKNK